jgi:hypothetical protein
LENPLPLTNEERVVLEDRCFGLSEVKNIEPDENRRGWMLEDMTDDELMIFIERDQIRQATIADQPTPEREKVSRPRERAARVPKIQSVKTAEHFIEKDGKLYRRETWTSANIFGDTSERHFDILCGQRVRWEGRLVSASIVLHWVRTGEVVAKVPRGERKPFRAQVRQGEKLVHLGYFATREERDAAIFAFRLGVSA